ncbi:MAG: hypothetical protein E5W92_31670 [Mesorhizobium sp.]|nr:MAG: hypothetical protein E5W92_31670 [Mesorhizobium sp.]
MGTADGRCQMCGREEIRYVHHMSHAHYPEGLDVGFVCAEKMEDDYVNPRRREQDLKNVASRRKRWLTRKWKISRSGNPFIKTDGFHIVVYPLGDGSWGGKITDLRSDHVVTNTRRYADADKAKLGAFDGMIFLKAKMADISGRE